MSSENKRDQRTIEQVLAESRARKKLKTEHSIPATSEQTSVQTHEQTDSKEPEKT